MGNDDIEILDDFSEENVPSNNLNQNTVPNNDMVSPAPVSNESINEFERMVTEAEPQSEPVPASIPEPSQQQFVPNYTTDLKNELDNSFVNDSNNDLISPDQAKVEEEPQPQQDLTITAVYPDGFALDQKEELENTQVIKPKAKGKGDIYLIIIVVVLAITLAVLLVTFYL